MYVLTPVTNEVPASKQHSQFNLGQLKFLAVDNIGYSMETKQQVCNVYIFKVKQRTLYIHLFKTAEKITMKIQSKTIILRKGVCIAHIALIIN